MSLSVYMYQHFTCTKQRGSIYYFLSNLHFSYRLGNHMVLRMIQSLHCTDICFLPYKEIAKIVSLLAILFISFGNPIHFFWQSYSFLLAILFISFGNPICFFWLSFSFLLVIIFIDHFLALFFLAHFIPY